METIRFDELNLDPRILRAVTDMGFEAASPIQAQAIPVEMEGHDMIGQAQTGTGKTAAFGIPLLMKMDPENRKTQAMILCPTRELAIQVAEELRRLAKYMSGIKILPVYGGQEIVKQIRSLKGGVQIIVGTPGRVMDHMRRKTIRTDAIHTVVLAQIAQKFQKDPKMVQVVKKELTVPKVTQYYYEVKPRNKVEVMCRLLDLYSPKLSVAFCNTKKQVDELVQALQGRGYFAEGLHGDLKQEQRDRVMSSFRNGATEILVATDVAARGIDVDDVEAVFNYDIPQDDEYYVHRIGRTGRAGREGRAFSLAVGSEVYKLRDIQRFCKTKIVPQPIPSLDDVTAIKAEKILDDVQQHIGEDSDLERMTDIIEKRLLAEDYTSLELAAAFLKMAMGDDYEDIVDEGRPLRDLDDLDRRGGRNDRGRNGRRRGRGDDEEYVDRKNARGGMTRLFINLGKNQNVKPGDILGAIAGESGIPGRLVGSIDMYDKYTFVEVPKDQADIVMDAMNHVKIKGKSVHVEKANRR